jgi:hypothetical protein
MAPLVKPKDGTAGHKVGDANKFMPRCALGT